MTGNRLRIGLLAVVFVVMSVICVHVVVAQSAYGKIQEETNREQLIREQVKVENLTDRVSYQESVHADVRLATLENTLGHIVELLVTLCGGIGLMIVERIFGIVKKRETA